MTSETIVEGLFLISVAIAVAIMVGAILPNVYSISTGFGLLAKNKDTEIRTDIRIVNYYATDTAMTIWMKNVGMTQFTRAEIDQSSVYAGVPDSFDIVSSDQVDFEIVETPINDRWDPRETLVVSVSGIALSENTVYFAMILPTGKKEMMIWDKTDILS